VLILALEPVLSGMDAEPVVSQSRHYECITSCAASRRPLMVAKAVLRSLAFCAKF